MAKGYGHRKLYPYVTAKQRKIAPGMVAFVKNNKSELEKQGNKVLSGPGEMTKSQAKSPLTRPWGRVQSKGTSARKISKYIDANGGSRGRAKKILASGHSVSFGADPKNR